ncbi:MAG TPA: phosphodiester glycosidase family protein [Candidatus Sulfomarinibacteraceae bacterium]|nr:phosphodiester glycosidase family protein [Candidatus Sulfomarinibacteraceae bacterium]
MRGLRRFLILLATVFLAACGAATPDDPWQQLGAPAPSAVATALPTARPSPTPPVPDSGWQVLRPGLEHRAINLVSGEGEWLENVTLLRLEPAHFHFDVRYRPDDPLDLVAWQAQTDAILVVNGGFFTETYQATGLIVVDGEASGVSYESFGGMFAITEQGPDLRWLPAQPYNPQETLHAALQSFPMLLTPGGVVSISEEDGQQARRTVVARDRKQRVLFILFNRGHFTLYELSRFLAESDLELDVALNLDGGASSGLYLAQPALYAPAFSLLPTVITVHERP